MVQIILQYRQCSDIKIVRRFIEEKDIWCLHQDAEQIETALPRHRTAFCQGILHVTREKKPLQHGGCGDQRAVRLSDIFCTAADIIDHTHIVLQSLVFL